MMLLVIGLMFVGSLFIGASIQAQERRMEVVSVECHDARCENSLELAVNRIDSLRYGWSQNLRINWYASSLATGEEVMQRGPCSEGWGAVIECTLPGRDTVPTFCFKEQNLTRAACTMCVAQLIDSCVRAGAEEEDDVFVIEDCQCGGGPP
jgi:hypothetical protein